MITKFELFENNKVILIYPIPSSKFDITKKIMNEVPKNTLDKEVKKSLRKMLPDAEIVFIKADEDN